jgi:hypothetical protein
MYREDVYLQVHLLDRAVLRILDSRQVTVKAYP